MRTSRSVPWDVLWCESWFLQLGKSVEKVLTISVVRTRREMLKDLRHLPKGEITSSWEGFALWGNGFGTQLEIYQTRCIKFCELRYGTRKDRDLKSKKNCCFSSFLFNLFPRCLGQPGFISSKTWESGDKNWNQRHRAKFCICKGTGLNKHFIS